MKKVLSVILLLTVMFCFASCSKAQPATLSQQTEEPTGDLKDTVTVNLPVTFLDPEYQNDLKGYCEKYGYISAKLSDDGQTVQIKMNKFSHELLTTEIGLKVLNQISEITDSGDYPYIKELVKIDRDNFKQVVIAVDGEEYKKAGTMAPYIIGQSCLLYQAYDSDGDYRCEVTVTDEETNKIIDTLVYTDKDE
ncbi:MAG: hypothetical protein ACI4SB_03260 [Acutalibacteraceae bacterium]